MTLGSVALLVATAACGGSHPKAHVTTQHYVPPAATPTTPFASPTPVPVPDPITPTPVTRTIRIIIDPFTDVGLKPGWSFDKNRASQQTVDCTYDGGSPYSLGIATHRCGATADGANACWASQWSLAELWCLDSSRPSSHKLWTIRAENVNDDTPAARNPMPLFLELQDGSRWWARTGGAWGGRDDGYDPIYGCANELGACAPDKQNATQLTILMKVDSHGHGTPVDKRFATWRVLVGQISGDLRTHVLPPVWMPVTRAWFMAGHRWHGD